MDVVNTKEREEGESISAHSDRSTNPVLQEFGQQLIVKTKTTAQLVRFGRELFDILLNEQQKTATTVHDIRVTDNDNLIFDGIVSAFEDRKVSLTCQSDIGQRISVLVTQGTMGIPELSRALASDPALTAHTLHEANKIAGAGDTCLLYTSPSPRDQRGSRMPSSA